MSRGNLNLPVGNCTAAVVLSITVQHYFAKYTSLVRWNIL